MNSFTGQYGSSNCEPKIGLRVPSDRTKCKCFSGGSSLANTLKPQILFSFEALFTEIGNQHGKLFGTFPVITPAIVPIQANCNTSTYPPPDQPLTIHPDPNPFRRPADPGLRPDFAPGKGEQEEIGLKMEKEEVKKLPKLDTEIRVQSAEVSMLRKREEWSQLWQEG
ncbi:uncharacterized protein BDR25DRAFT_360467 [Lindgomyces ingoldianus]|uniref:Uncharacterized protein n=1 Tax=Lindgomyces ingoldianus TaxID=673940 RepID=A0ACB6QF53_9PLEO|nr:uncharacterized protein BDR25DRAFT_360467 [Lindgomyces ingoldianus]KAF2465521.1 hypothetical protein BDR25DRAFT_360467 [Lindgomyces ingoldianus]